MPLYCLWRNPLYCCLGFFYSFNYLLGIWLDTNISQGWRKAILVLGLGKPAAFSLLLVFQFCLRLILILFKL